MNLTPVECNYNCKSIATLVCTIVAKHPATGRLILLIGYYVRFVYTVEHNLKDHPICHTVQMWSFKTGGLW